MDTVATAGCLGVFQVKQPSSTPATQDSALPKPATTQPDLAQRSCFDRRVKSWMTCWRDVNVLKQAPIWPIDRPFSEGEARRLAEVAGYFQHLAADDVELAIICYMMTLMSKSAEERTANAFDSRPMLVMRVMFDLPTDIPIDYEQMACRPPQITMPAAGVVAPVDISMSPTAPIKWTGEGPRILFSRRDIDHTGNPYEPEREYRYFRAHFPLRDLKHYLGDNDKYLWKLINTQPDASEHPSHK